MRVLFVNPRSGDAEWLDELCGAAEARGIAVRELDELESAVAGADAIGVAGGDGSLAPVARVALDRDLPFVPVPAGTRNHFARDLGFDRDDPVGALGAYDGPERRVDVGTVNGRIFLINVSLGAYASAIRDPGYRDVALRRLVAALIRFRRAPLRLVVEGDDRSVLVLLVGNNEYRLASLADLADVGGRERLDGGALYAYEIHRERLRLRFDTRKAQSFRVEANESLLKAALDGEPIELEPPLEFAIRPRALRVRILP